MEPSQGVGRTRCRVALGGRKGELAGEEDAGSSWDMLRSGASASLGGGPVGLEVSGVV